ncbi:glycerate kinase subfamily [Verrucomicrobiia bacterium DG1235]|nr:glycerate kinase subfamily [Verrucomicrobiae bacterium DG1235]
MKNALIAFDKFKDALTAHQACAAAAEAFAEIYPDWTVATSPLADGGDGFCDTLTRLCDGRFESSSVSGPLGQETTARYGIVETKTISPPAAKLLALPANTKTLAIVEFAQSSGIALVPQDQRSPWTTTSYGLGQTIAHAKASGADAILVGLGGSATHDLALGALQALGYRFLDKDSNEVAELPIPEKWEKIRSIQVPNSPLSLPVRIACDVENPLLGPNGAAAIFGPQKGLLKKEFQLLDSETNRLAILLCHATRTGIQMMNTSGAGAAGGAAFGLMAALDGSIVPGADLVFAWSSLHEKLAAAELVITGEGRFDASSLQGKGPGSLARLSLAEGKRLIILAGSLGPLPDPKIADYAKAISPPNMPLPEALAKTEANIRAAIRSVLTS